ncbi:OmpA family protein [Lutimaribacter marinistellae]|uniref:OmpA family protein n=1 Tax=Lutimaribacter marinistellae TaxID=1820329 RepID=A0ABV7TLG9_9RHOB
MKNFLRSSTAVMTALAMTLPQVANAQRDSESGPRLPADVQAAQDEAQRAAEAEAARQAQEAEAARQAAEAEAARQAQEAEAARQAAEAEAARQAQEAEAARQAAEAEAARQAQEADAARQAAEAEAARQAQEAEAARQAAEAEAARQAQEAEAARQAAEAEEARRAQRQREVEQQAGQSEGGPRLPADVQAAQDQQAAEQQQKLQDDLKRVQQEAEASAAREAEAQKRAEALERELERVRTKDADEAPQLDSTQQARRAERLSQEAEAAEALTGREGKRVRRQIERDQVRRSNEEFDTQVNAAANPPAASGDDGISDFGKAALVGIGALAINQLLRGGEEVVTQSDDRLVVRGDEGLRVIKDDNQLLYRPGSNVDTETFSDGSTRTFVSQPDGSEVVTIRAADGRVLRRSRLLPGGQEVVLFDDTKPVQPVEVSQLPRAQMREFSYEGQASGDELRRAILDMQGSEIDRNFSLSQIRYIDDVRQLVPEISVNNVRFDTNSAAIRPDQARDLAELGYAMREAIEKNPAEVFLVEGHTDATGTAGYNLALSDRRAETVALALTEYFNVPPANIVVQGYGESVLKVPTTSAEPANRRVAVRRITPLLN